jgi:hypothetical protein
MQAEAKTAITFDGTALRLRSSQAGISLVYLKRALLFEDSLRGIGKLLYQAFDEINEKSSRRRRRS